jgi:hypothetical protein
MGRRRKTKEGTPINLGFRVPPDLLHAVDAEAERMSAERKGLKVSRSQMVMMLLWEALDARAKTRGR